MIDEEYLTKKNQFQLPTSMKVAALTKKTEVNIENHPVPNLEDDEVMVKIEAVGICGSDVHYFEHGHIGDRYVNYPHIQGHECAGVVVDVGDKVKRFTIGERVAVEPGVACMSCDWCKKGKYNLCPDIHFLSTPPVKGAFVQYLSHREEFIYPIPNSLSFEVATLAEPLSVGIHALRRGNIKPGAITLITGMGPVGLLTVIAAKYYGAENIIVTDMESKRLSVAKQLGATKTVNVGETDLKHVVNQFTNNKGVDMIIETSGNEKAIRDNIQLINRGGSLVQVGFPIKEVPIDMTYMLQHEIDLYAVYRYVNTYPDAIKILNNMRQEITQMITDYFSMNDIQEAMDKAHLDKENSIKVMVYPNKKISEEEK